MENQIQIENYRHDERHAHDPAQNIFRDDRCCCYEVDRMENQSERFQMIGRMPTIVCALAYRGSCPRWLDDFKHV
jgi:hypothetical protein